MTNASSVLGEIPFEPQVALSDGTTLTILSVKRYLPQRRLVCRGIWQNQVVFVKLFIGKDALHYANRDKAGVFELTKSLIKTPKLIGELAINSPPGIALIFEVVEPALNAEELWQISSSSSRLSLMRQLVETVAEHHKVNLLQTDLHLKNFLAQDSTIYTLDGDGVRKLSSLFKHHKKMHNLATLLSKMDASNSGWIEDLYAHYCKQTGISYSPTDYADLYALTQKIRQKTANSYADKKVFRICTDVKVSQNFNQFTALSSDFGAKNLNVNQLDNALDNAQSILKSGNTCTVGSALIANQQLVIKRYNIKNFWHGVKLAVSQSRAAKSWANAHRLTILNISTAKPLALIEARFGWIKRRAYFLSANIDSPDIAEFFAANNDVETKQKVAFDTALLFYKLNLLQISHGDCKASNIKIVEGKPVMIDLDSMQSHTCAWWFEKKHIKDLKRLMQNWANNPETSAIFKQAFVQAYDEIDDYLLPTILERAKIA